MTQDLIPTMDAALLTFGTTLAAAVTAAPASFGLAAADIAPVSADVNQFGQALQDVDALKAELASAVRQKEQIRLNVEAGLRSVARRIQADPAVTDDTRSNAGIPIRDFRPSSTAPNPPTDLVAAGLVSGVNELSWDRNGNLPNTEFVIEAMKGAETTFSQVDVTRAARYRHTGQTVGVKVIYRVRARRDGISSDNCREAGVYLV